MSHQKYASSIFSFSRSCHAKARIVVERSPFLFDLALHQNPIVRVKLFAFRSGICRQRFLSTTASNREKPAKSSLSTDSDPPKRSRRARYFWIPILGFGLAIFFAIDEGRRRSVAFWATAFPAYCHYRFVEWVFNHASSAEPAQDAASRDAVQVVADPNTQVSAVSRVSNRLANHVASSERLGFGRSRTEAFQRLHDMYSPQVEDLCYRLRGMYLKNAQFMSLREDIVPETYLKWCRKLQNMAPTPISAETARDILIQELGHEKLAENFESIDFDNPIGSAAIGVVFLGQMKVYNSSQANICEDERARVAPPAKRRYELKPVAIKVQLPGTEAQFRADLETLRFFCSFAFPSIMPGFDELERQFLSEFNYVEEARNLRTVHDGWCKLLEQEQEHVFPRRLWWTRPLRSAKIFGNGGLSGRSIRVPAPVEHLCTKYILTMEYLDGQPFVRGLERIQHKIAQKRQIDPGIVEREFRAELEAGKHRSLRHSSWRFWMIQLMYGTDFNPAEFVNLLLHYWCYQVFADGVVQTDPHPGNFLVLRDNKTLGCIDFGQLKRLPREKRIPFAKLVIAIHRGDKHFGNRIGTEELNCRSKFENDDIRWEVLKFWMDEDDPRIVSGEMNLDQLVRHWQEVHMHYSSLSFDSNQYLYELVCSLSKLQMNWFSQCSQDGLSFMGELINLSSK